MGTYGFQIIINDIRCRLTAAILTKVVQNVSGVVQILQFAVSRASLIFQKRFPDAVSTLERFI